jgi:hypothetical protein
VNPYHILRAAAIGNMRRNGEKMPWEPIEKGPMLEWLDDQWQLYARREGVDLYIKVGMKLAKVVHTAAAEPSILYQGDSYDQAIFIFNKNT